MNVENIKDKNIINNILNLLLKTPNLKSKDISINDQNNNPYIHFGIDINNRIDIAFATNNFVNDEEEDLDNDKFIEALGLDPDATIKGPIEYKEIEDIYEYLNGSTNDIIDNKQKVFLCIDQGLIKILESKKSILTKNLNS